MDSRNGSELPELEICFLQYLIYNWTSIWTTWSVKVLQKELS